MIGYNWCGDGWEGWYGWLGGNVLNSHLLSGRGFAKQDVLLGALHFPECINGDVVKGFPFQQWGEESGNEGRIPGCLCFERGRETVGLS